MISNRWMDKIKKGTACVCACVMLCSTLCAEAAGNSDNVRVPADATSGGMIYSDIYGQVLVTRRPSGINDYTFFNDDRPAVQELLRQLNAGKKIDLDKLLTGSSTAIKNITTDDNVRIPNDIQNSGADAKYTRASYGVGTEYGPDLKEWELEQLQTLVADFLVKNNVASMSELKKVRTAHDYLMQFCVPAPDGNRNHADNAWGALIYREANSKGYARAMKALCDAMGIGCYIVSANNSSARKNCMWNVVMIGDYWYIVDVFCDDSTNTYAMYLLSDKSYQMYGMRWNTGNGLPVCKKNYGS